jgi:site-specific recombinase XerD
LGKDGEPSPWLNTACAGKWSDMARLYQRGRVWYSDLFIGGKRVQKALSTDRKIAEGMLGDLVKQRNAGKHGHAVTSSTYAAAKERFLKVYTHKSPVTYRHYLRSFNSLESALPVKELSQITPDVLTDILDKWKKAGRGLYIRNRDIENAVSFMRRSETWRMVAPQDWDTVEGKDKEPRGRVEFFTPKEVGTLLSKTWGMWRTMAMLGARAGLRPGEMYFLEWTDLDLERGKLHVDSKLHLGFHIKTYERRTIPMPADLKDYLVRLAKKKTSTFVLVNDDGDRPKSTDVMSTYFSRRVRAAGLKGHLYKLRHTYGSHLAQAGRRLDEIRDLMGHKSVMTTEIYAHLLPHAYVDAVNSLPAVRLPKK